VNTGVNVDGRTSVNIGADADKRSPPVQRTGNLFLPRPCPRALLGIPKLNLSRVFTSPSSLSFSLMYLYFVPCDAARTDNDISMPSIFTCNAQYGAFVEAALNCCFALARECESVAEFTEKCKGIVAFFLPRLSVRRSAPPLMRNFEVNRVKVRDIKRGLHDETA